MDPQDVFDYFNEEDYLKIDYEDRDKLVPTDDICDDYFSHHEELEINIEDEEDYED